MLEIHSVHLKQSTSEKYQEGYEEKFSVSSCNSNRDVLKLDQSSINRLSKPFLNLVLQQTILPIRKTQGFFRPFS
jgi:hypothetical protein